MDFSAIHPNRVSPDYADERIREKIGQFGQHRSQAGLRRLATDLKASGVPDHARLHLMIAVADLGLAGERTLKARIRRATELP